MQAQGPRVLPLPAIALAQRDSAGACGADEDGGAAGSQGVRADGRGRHAEEDPGGVEGGGRGGVQGAARAAARGRRGRGPERRTAARGAGCQGGLNSVLRDAESGDV
eukprot:1253867-Rhodomonas_salina.1